jgi:integrase
MKFQTEGWVVGDKFWKKSHKSYYCDIVHPDRRREQRRLSDDANTAEGLRAEIIAGIRREGVPTKHSTAHQIFNEFLDRSEANNSPKTYKGYRTYLRSLDKTLPKNLRIADFSVAHMDRWMTKCYPAKGNPNTRRAAVAAVKICFNWATNILGVLDKNPLAKYPTPAAAPREVYLQPQQWAVVLDHYPPEDPFHDYLRVLICTGSRPQEVRIMAARHIDWKRQTASFAKGEVPGKKSVARVIRLPTDVLAILRKRALRYPQGPLLRNEDDKPWSSNAVRCRFTRLQKKIPDFHPFAYLARHSFLTLVAEQGKAKAGDLAQIGGHKDATMVLKVYANHFDHRQEHLLDCVESVDPLGEKAKQGKTAKKDHLQDASTQDAQAG